MAATAPPFGAVPPLYDTPYGSPHPRLLRTRARQRCHPNASCHPHAPTVPSSGQRRGGRHGRGAPKGGRAAWQEGKRELKTAELDAESPEGERVKGAITRVVGNLVGTTGDTKRDKDADVLRAVKEMVQAGLQVQAEGDEMCRAVRKQLGDENSSLASVRKLASRWRKLVLQGGPARAEKLRRVYAAEEGIR